MKCEAYDGLRTLLASDESGEVKLDHADGGLNKDENVCEKAEDGVSSHEMTLWKKLNARFMVHG